MSRRPIISVDLTGAGEHPAAWRIAGSPFGDDLRRLVDGSTVLEATLRAEAGGVDFVTFGDTFEAPRDVPGAVTTRPDALGLAARIAPDTKRIGLVPTITTTHTEPFHVQASVATLDWVSQGRAGWLVDVSTTNEAAAAVGRRGVAVPSELWSEATDAIEVSRKLWDSWEDDAIIRDADTGRFVDRDKLHYVDHAGPTFSVKGPSIVPRPPQGHPVVVVRVSDGAAVEAATGADVVLLPIDAGDDVAARVLAVRDAVEAAGRDRDEVLILASASVLLADSDATAAERGHALDALAGGDHPIDVVGTKRRLRERILAWSALGVDGVHLRPAVIAVDLPRLLDEELPRLQARSYAAHDLAPARTLRDRLTLARPQNQYAVTAS